MNVKCAMSADLLVRVLFFPFPSTGAYSVHFHSWVNREASERVDPGTC